MLGFRSFSKRSLRWTTKARFLTTEASSQNGVCVRKEPDSGIAWIRMNRPPVNGLTPEFMNNLTSSLYNIEADKSCKAAVLISDVPRIFCAGLDLKAFVGLDEKGLREYGEALYSFWMALYGFPLPLVGALNGHTLAGGCLISSTCDYRIITKGSKVGLPESKVGLIVPYYLREMMCLLQGRRQAEKSLVFGTVYAAEEGKEVGLVDEILSDPSEMEAKVRNFLQHAIAVPEAARRDTKIKMRMPLLSAVASRKQEIMKDFVEERIKPSTQQAISAYIASLKK